MQNRFPRVLRNFLVGYLILHTIAAVLLVSALSQTLRNQMIENTKKQMTAMALMLSQHIGEINDGINDASLPAHLKSLGERTRFRFTVVDMEGRVVADSETGTKDIGFHGDRPEILASQLGEPGFSTRHSATLQIPMMYLAVTLQESQQGKNGIIRVAVPAVAINSTIASLQRYVILFAISLGALAALLTVLFSTYLLKPLVQFSDVAKRIGVGQYDAMPMLLNRNDEWGSLADAFRQMQSELSIREKRIVKTRDRLEAVLSSMIEGVVAMDSKKQVKIANRAACRMFSISESEIMDRDLLDVVRIPELTSAIEAVEKTQSSKQFSKIEFETLGASPRKKISARVSVLPSEANSDGQQHGIVTVLHDVTELRQLENLRHDFVANVSHELKTPLTSIKACAETLRLGAIHDDAKNIFFLEQIESSAELLEQQILDLLQLARIESGKENWQIESLAINDLCHQCVIQFESEASNRNIDLVFVSNPAAPTAMADYEAVVSILNNLISNALRYTPASGRVEVSAIRNDDEIVLQVIDTGIGIADEHHSRIFERFYRVDRARARDDGGTGLGLAIVKHLTNAIGGQVSVDSEPGKGSSFTVRLPSS